MDSACRMVAWCRRDKLFLLFFALERVTMPTNSKQQCGGNTFHQSILKKGPDVISNQECKKKKTYVWTWEQ